MIQITKTYIFIPIVKKHTKLYSNIYDNSYYRAVETAKDELEKIAHYDPLTGLPNRKLFLQRSAEAIRDSKAHENYIALLYMDLDKFKQINDSLGHSMGDIVLKTVASQLSGIIGDDKTICRLGGDEFTILLPSVDKLEDVISIKNKIIDTIERPWILKGKEYSLGISIGYAIFPGDGKDVEELMEIADQGMYKEKQHRKAINL